jgi:hypothetical protein
MAAAGIAGKFASLEREKQTPLRARRPILIDLTIAGDETPLSA